MTIGIPSSEARTMGPSGSRMALGKQITTLLFSDCLSYLALLIMVKFTISSPGFDGWHTVGDLRSPLCSISKPAKFPRKLHNQRNAQRLATLKGRILSTKFVSPRLKSVKTTYILGEDF